MQILVLSSDKGGQTFELFHHCMEKYWPNHPEIIYSTETIKNPYYKTINKNYPLSEYTLRVRDTLKELSDSSVIIMVDDIFLRSQVDNDYILKLNTYINDDVGAINFEKSFDENDIIYNDTLMLRGSSWVENSLMCQLWNRENAIKVFDCRYNPWEFEGYQSHRGYKFFVQRNSVAMNWGHREINDKWGIVQGKWEPECIEFSKKEGIILNIPVQRHIENHSVEINLTEWLSHTELD